MEVSWALENITPGIQTAQRYAIKPLYPRGGPKQSLPSKPVLYLGLSRLFPIGETKDGDLTKLL